MQMTKENTTQVPKNEQVGEEIVIRGFITNGCFLERKLKFYNSSRA